MALPVIHSASGVTYLTGCMNVTISDTTTDATINHWLVRGWQRILISSQ